MRICQHSQAYPESQHPSSRLSKLEVRLQARLLRQFEEYPEMAIVRQRLKEVRKEALVAGFAEAYRADRFQDILTANRKRPKRLLESSPDLFDFVDIAQTKVER